MANTPLKPPGSSNSRPHAGNPSNNLAKALLEAGGHVAQSTVDTGVQMAGDALSSLFGSSSSTSFPQQQNDGGENFPGQEGQNFFSPEQQEQEWKQREMRMLRHREIQQTDVFDARKLDTDRKITQILNELQALAKDLDEADRQARDAKIAVMQGAVQGGDYHVSFFEKLLKTIILLRQRVKESASWLAQFNTRGAAKSKKGYWAQFHANGTQWAMSGERSIATSVG